MRAIAFYPCVQTESVLVTPSTPCETLQQACPDLKIQSWQAIEPSLTQQLEKTGFSAESLGCVAYPQTQIQLGEILTLADKQGLSILPFGSGSKLSWGGLPKRADLWVSTAHLNRLVDHAIGDMTITIEAGMKLIDLQRTLAEAGQFLPLDPLYSQQATIGGIIATASAGSLRQRYGGVRDLLLGISFARADGQLVKAGGRVVKNVAGYDMMKLLTGSYGTLGVLTQATFRVYAAPENGQTVLVFGDRTALSQALQQINNSSLAPTALDLISSHLAAELGAAKQDSLLIRFQTIPAGIQAQVEQVEQLAKSLGLSTTRYPDENDKSLWQRLSMVIEQQPPERCFLCKIGVKPTFAGDLMTQVQTLIPEQSLTVIHGSSGLGWLRSPEPNPDVINQLHQHCQTWGGFLTILEASPTLKDQIEVWGYTGNALEMMRRLKQQFDPNGVLSPGRFVGEI